ncbi:MAG: thioredoxin-disulfide reductase [Dehalococcoidales bacterium]|nr:MAG: thioredoxin-disulfide reductase [Dehalococcoidales bacterium]
MPQDKTSYDVIITGGGPAGLSAGIYTARARLSTLLIERLAIGGQIATAEQVDNYPGFPDGIGGFELGQLMHQQATKYGLQTVTADVTSIKPAEKDITVNTTADDYTARAVIIAGGSKRQKLGVPGEEEFTGRGVSYCATCDAAFFREKPVAVVGGGDAAITEAIHLTKFASKVTVIHRRNELRATRILQEIAFAQPNMEFSWDSTVEAIEGESFVERLSLNNVRTGEKSTLVVSGVFISIGFQPDTGFLKGVVPMDANGLIITNERMETGIPGIYAAGDIRQNSARQAITAAGDGATAAIYAQKYLTEQA